MEITARQEGDATVLVVTGDIDLETSPALRTVLKAQAEKAKSGKAQGTAAALVLDFSGVGYIDSSGLATLIEYYQTVRDGGRGPALANVSQRVRSAFELVRLNEIFPFYANVDEALQAVRAR
jgi:anti-sigma B factor antagonist